MSRGCDENVSDLRRVSEILEMKLNEDGFHYRMRSQSRSDDDDDDDDDNEVGGLCKKERPTFSNASIFCYLDVEVPYPSHFDPIVFRPCPFDVNCVSLVTDCDANAVVLENGLFGNIDVNDVFLANDCDVALDSYPPNFCDSVCPLSAALNACHHQTRLSLTSSSPFHLPQHSPLVSSSCASSPGSYSDSCSYLSCPANLPLCFSHVYFPLRP